MPAKNIKPMGDVQKGVSARFKETLARLAKEEAAKKVKRNPDGSAKKPGKPKPTAGKGINKNIITVGGKKGRALENKMRSEMGLPKLQTTGKAKAVKKASIEKTGRAAGSVNLGSKGKITEYMTDKKVKGSARKIRDNAQRVELEAKGVSKRKSLPKYGRGMRGGGTLGGGGLRSNVTK
jgi:hypothetical protein